MRALAASIMYFSAGGRPESRSTALLESCSASGPCPSREFAWASRANASAKLGSSIVAARYRFTASISLFCRESSNPSLKSRNASIDFDDGVKAAAFIWSIAFGERVRFSWTDFARASTALSRTFSVGASALIETICCVFRFSSWASMRI